MNETVIDNLIIEISADSSAAGSNIDTVTAALNRLNSTNNKTKKTASSLSKLASSIKGLAITRVLGNAVSNINAYVENVNLFTVAMGKYSEEAMAYAERVQDAMGIDASEFMRNQAIFKNMADGFGLAEDQAYKLSRGLTELAYDVSSLYNVDMETTFQRLQSGLAGEIEPVRRWGIALDQASMKQWMLKKGIDANISSLTQADKAMIRYNMMVETMANRGAIGDLARTLETPANAIRILNQQITQLSRAIGTLLIPILVKVIPYIQAFVKVVTNAAQALANLLGIDITFDVDYSGLTSGAGAAADAMDDASASAKKLKDYVMGFDELNIISPDTGSGAGQAAGGASLGLEAMSVWDESILKMVEERVDDLTKRMKILAAAVGIVGAGFAAWKIGSGIAAAISGIKTKLASIAGAIIGMGGSSPKLAKLFGIFTKYAKPIAITAAVIATVSLAIMDLWKNSEKFRDTVKAVAEKVKESFIGLKDALWNNAFVPIMDAFNITAKSFGDFYASYIRPIVDAIAILFVKVLGGAITLTIDAFALLATVVGNAVGFMVNTIADFVSTCINKFVEVKNGTGDLLRQSVEYWIERFTYAKDTAVAIVKAMKKNLVGHITNLRDQFKNMFSEIKTTVSTAADSLRDTFERIKGYIGGLIKKINEAILAFEDLLSINIGNTTIGVDIPTIGSGDKLGLKIGKYATGGFLEDGLFTMNHGEIAGKFSNGQSVVANNQQIVEGISDGVYRAVVAAQSDENSKPMQVNVYLDGKQISKSVDKYNNSRGKAIMGNSLGYNF